MTNRQAFGNLLWILIFLAALTSPFWGHWLFGVGAILMAIAGELRMDRQGPRPTTYRRAVTRPFKESDLPDGPLEQVQDKN